jgi:hypothetical protein
VHLDASEEKDKTSSFSYSAIGWSLLVISFSESLELVCVLVLSTSKQNFHWKIASQHASVCRGFQVKQVKGVTYNVLSFTHVFFSLSL